jgi:putative endonuclease
MIAHPARSARDWHASCSLPRVPAAGRRQSLGILGEDLACAELLRRGYAILARRYRTRFGEIDIITERDDVVVFVEVKARRSRRFGTAAEAIPIWKRRRIGAMALDYLAWTGRLTRRCRFDVVAIDGVGTPAMTVRVIEDAFQVN